MDNVKERMAVDLSVLIKSGIDCEFSDIIERDGWCVGREGGLHGIYDRTSYYDGADIWSKCRPRMNHWHSWQGGECPLPEGLMVQVKKWSVHNPHVYTEIIPSEDWRTKKPHQMSTIIAFKVTGLANGYCWPWQE